MFTLDYKHFLKQVWSKDKELQNEGFYIDDIEMENILSIYDNNIKLANNVNELLLKEAIATKQLYKYAATGVIKTLGK